MMIDKFSDALAGNDGAYEPQRGFHWILTVHPLKGEFNWSQLQLSLRSGVAPNISNEETEIPFFNSKVYVAGKVAYEAASFSFTDYVDPDIAGELYKWRRLVYDPETHKMGMARDYKFDADLSLFAPNLDDKLSRVWKIQGMWPTSTNFGSLAFDGNEPVQIEVNFRYDRCFPLKRLGKI